MKITELISEGKEKKVWATDDADLIVLEFKDEVTTADKKKSKIKDRGSHNSAVSAQLFQYLENYYVPTHFVKVQSDKQIVCKKMEMIPVEIRVRNYAAGEFVKRYQLEKGQELATPVIEMFLKNEKAGNPMINEYHTYAFELATTDEMRTIIRTTTKINAVLKSFFERRNLKLVDFKLEFGRYKDQILLGDELSLDSITVWNINDKGEVDPKKFDLSAAKSDAPYNELRERLVK